MRSFIQQYMVSAQYFAPRGKERLMFLGEQITHKHLSYTDRLVGIIGDAGAGKSSFIKGMFPGLQLSNDDDIVRPDKIMEVRTSFLDVGDASTRSEERRVGKECRSRWSREQEKKKR